MDIVAQFQEFKFAAGNEFRWSPEARTIGYDPKRIDSDKGRIMLLHEIGHALLGHKQPADERRYQIERDAWDVARVLAEKFGLQGQEPIIAHDLQELCRLGY